MPAEPSRALLGLSRRWGGAGTRDTVRGGGSIRHTLIAVGTHTGLRSHLECIINRSAGLVHEGLVVTILSPVFERCPRI
jgi:hypothetical protein